MSETVTVIKKVPAIGETWRYSGNVLRRLENAVLIEALFNRDDLMFFGMPLRRGDRFVEVFYSDRWYNIFEIHDRDDDRLKGWYCNICQPAEITNGQVSYVDLALDFLVFPDGRQLVLDEDEFTALNLSEAERDQADTALLELKRLFAAPAGFSLERYILS